MIAIVDYGVGNLFSLKSSFAAIGAEVFVTSSEQEIRDADKIVLPGVGAFEDAAKKLRECGLDKVIKEEVAEGKLLLGICLGMQLLFEKSYEYGEHEGLGLLKGVIRPISEVAPPELKIPHMGWNALQFTREHPLFRRTKEGDCVYFVHSYHAADCDESKVAFVEYGGDITAAAAKKNVMGCQFHPEKSANVGLDILRSFCELKEGDLC
ncbi:MAG: imidazole glycerol phosphate synthase subunit HisH [Lachnospiraceae bacterium]|nr:imidazole glycerol phosphate synthase subunit HisH [Lachnospiraceae bacterium]